MKKMKKMSGPLGGFFWLTLYDVSRRTFLDNSCAYRYLKMRTLFISIFVECINKRLQRLSGLELSGSWGWTPPKFMLTGAHFWVKISFKFQTLSKISNISAADPPVLLGHFQHCRLWLGYDLIHSSMRDLLGQRPKLMRFGSVRVGEQTDRSRASTVDTKRFHLVPSETLSLQTERPRHTRDN